MQKNWNGGVSTFAVPFPKGSRASKDVRHLNVVVVVSCVNELSLLRGFLFAAGFFRLLRGLLFSCHIVLSPF